MLAVVLILSVIAAFLMVAAVFPRLYRWFSSIDFSDPEADHDPYGFWEKRDWLEDDKDPCPGPACYGEGNVCYLHTDADTPEVN